jgi:hypothetical protein
VPDFDRDAFRRSVQALRSSDPLRNRGETTRSTQPERAAISRQIHEETIETLEGALTQAGIDVRKLRVALGRNQKRAVDAVAATVACRRNIASGTHGDYRDERPVPFAASAGRASNPAQPAIVAHFLERACRHYRVRGRR